MQTENQIIVLPEGAPLENRFTYLTARDAEPLWTRLYQVMRALFGHTEKGSPLDHSDPEPGIEIESEAHADLAFLKLDAVAPFPVRLRRELTETIRAIRQDPALFISQIAMRKSSTPEHKRRRNTGIMVAMLVYAVGLSAICLSYVILHRRNSGGEEQQHLKITHLQLPPMPVANSLPALKQPGGTSKSPVPVPAQPPEPPKTEPIKSAPQPRALEQTPTNPEPQTHVASAVSEPPIAAEAKASTGPAANGTGDGLGTGNGTGSGTGSEGVQSARVNYNDVFSVNSVTARPQILGRPTPGYTEEARRAQVEGAVRLSVVLDADGTVSEIRVVRGLGYGLDERATEAARQLRFVAAQKDGHKVSVRVFLEFKFTLL